jgi:hypothetical protein
MSGGAPSPHASTAAAYVLAHELGIEWVWKLATMPGTPIQEG